MTYRDMKEQVEQALQDGRVKSLIPEFIRQGQLLLERKLRIRAMESLYISSIQDPAVVLASGVNTLALPTDYIELIYIGLIDGSIRHPLNDRKSAKDFVDSNRVPLAYTTQTGLPFYYTRMEDSLYFDRYTEKTYNYELMYFAHLSTLTNEADTNWWTTNASEALLYAALTVAIPMLPLQETKRGLAVDPRVGDWRGMLDFLLGELGRNDNRERLSGAPKRTRYID